MFDCYCEGLLTYLLLLLLVFLLSLFTLLLLLKLVLITFSLPYTDGVSILPNIDVDDNPLFVLILLLLLSCID